MEYWWLALLVGTGGVLLLAGGIYSVLSIWARGRPLE